MSKYSEVIGSFIRRGEYPLEADYIFASETALKEFYSDPVQNAILHKGLLKVVEDDGTGNQALYWVTKKQTNDQLEFTKLINGSFIKSLVPQIEKIIKDLEEEIKERQNGDSALWGTINPTIIPEDLNSVLDLSKAIQDIRDELANQGIGQLDGLVQEAYYDSDKESLVIVFMMQDGKTQKLQIPFTNVIREWEPDNRHPNKVVELYREEVYSGGADKLSADVRISSRVDNILEKDGNTLFVQGTTDNIDHNGTALNLVIRRLNKRIAALEKIIEEGNFGDDEVIVPINITSFDTDIEHPLECELGTTINPYFSWSYNIGKVDIQTLNGSAIDIVERKWQLNGITKDTKVTLFASYKGYSDTREIEFKFIPRIYYGTSASDSLNNVTGLESHLGNINGAQFDCSYYNNGGYAYIVVPFEYKDRIVLKVNSNMELKAYTISEIFVNNKKHALLKLDNKYHGHFNMDINLI